MSVLTIILIFISFHLIKNRLSQQNYQDENQFSPLLSISNPYIIEHFEDIIPSIAVVHDYNKDEFLVRISTIYFKKHDNPITQRKDNAIIQLYQFVNRNQVENSNITLDGHLNA